MTTSIEEPMKENLNFIEQIVKDDLARERTGGVFKHAFHLNPMDIFI